MLAIWIDPSPNPGTVAGANRIEVEKSGHANDESPPGGESAGSLTEILLRMDATARNWGPPRGTLVIVQTA